MIFRKLLLILSFLLACNTGWPQYVLQNSGSPIIEKMTSQYKGKTLSLSQLDQIVRELSQDGLFQVVYVEQLSGNKVVVRAQKSVKIKSINIIGNSSYKKTELMEAMGIEAGQTLSELEIIQGIERIKSIYQDSGFYNFRIKYSKKLSDDGLDLNINIDEKDFCLIEDIQIFSKNENLNNKINDLIPSLIKTSYQTETAVQIEKKINDLLLENRYLTAKVQNTATIFNKNKTRVKLRFTINNPIQFEFVFHGNKFFSHFDLINESEIGTKFLYVSDSSSEIIDNISALYLKNGFPNVKIRAVDSYFTDQQKKVYVFDIDEGERIRIGKIEVVGKISRKKSFYVSLFKEYLALEAHSVYFVRKDIEHAASEMVTHLKRNGHLLAELLSVNAEVTEQNNALITIQIDEGILTYVRQILFRGSKSFSNIDLKDQIKIEPNKPIKIQEVEDSFEKIEAFYREKGYLEFKIKNRNATVIKYKPGQPYADLVYEVTEGPKIYVKDIKVNGLQKTKEYVVLRELDFKIGDLLTQNKVTTTVNRLERIGLFGKVNVRSLEQNTDIGRRTIIVDLEERKPGLFSSGIGVQSNGLFTLRGYVGALYNNLWGKARGLSSRVDLNYTQRVEYPENRISLSYYEPFLTESRLRGRVSLVRQEQFNNWADPDTQDNAVIRTSNEIRFSTEKEFTKHFRFTYNVWGFTNLEFKDVDGVLDSAAFDLSQVQNIATTGPVFELDYRNDPFVPTKGSYSRLEIEYSDPALGSSRDNPEVSGADPTNPLRPADLKNEINYIRTSFQTTVFTPLTKSKKWVWANSLRGGYLSNISSRSDSGVPQIRSFFLGGSSTLRGFAIGEFVPGQRELCIKQGFFGINDPDPQCSLSDIVVRDDSTFVLLKSELRFPLAGNWGGLLFYDGGAVFLGEFKLEDPWRDSVGFGISYDTPVGSFVIGVGFKLDRKTGGVGTFYDTEDPWALHLAIGNF